jgi:GntR family transcriptional regulator/MocR family aminotransferase
MYIPLDRDSGEPLPAQIARYLEELIRRGHLASQFPLPATRTLARTLGVAVSTVEAAYETLEAAKLVRVRRGQGVTVCGQVPQAAALDLPLSLPPARDPFSAKAWLPEEECPLKRDFSGTLPRLLNVSSRTLRLWHQEALAAARGALFLAPASLGEIALRQAASRHLSACGVLCEPDEVVILPDRGTALEGLLRLFVPPGGAVVAGSLPDPDLARALRARGAELRLLPSEPEEGRSLALGTARLFLVSSSGSRLPQSPLRPEARREILDHARARGVPIVEDATNFDREETPESFPSLGALDRSGRVFTICDLSDEIGGAFRAAALAATPKVVERLRRSAGPAESPGRLTQQVLARALEHPSRRRTLRKVRERRRLLIPAILRSLRRRLPELLAHEFTPGADGLRLDLPEGISGDTLRDAARSKGVFVLSARDCGADPGSDRFVLLDLTRLEEGELLEGIRLLGATLDELDAASGVTGHSRAPEAALLHRDPTES